MGKRQRNNDCSSGMRCRVCRAPKAKAELDSTGRCASCADAKDATDAGITYGAYKAKQYAAAMEIRAKQEKMRCGAGERQSQTGERDALERGAIRPQQQRTEAKPPRVCPQCGKILTGKKIYCGDTCKYLFNQERIKQRKKEREAKQEKERTAALCRHCGKEIFSKRRSRYCSEECARAAHIAQKRKNRRDKKGEKGQ